MINIADFSRYPSGRDHRDGDNNGTRFREEVLCPAIEEAVAAGNKVVVSLDGVNSMGSSFLEETFGGLVRNHGYGKDFIKSILEVTTNRESFKRYVDAAWRYIDSAA
ncbi:STAS-like domain-containing protein [Asticcacaulis sp. AC460]|uniref:STAS-like domain-containing protein n=1 Tax=Asticcacaulis sp. AC460 TaxID=1282360 RepID=UPI0012DE39AD